MNKAWVTRCPYCGAIWRITDRDMAERGPVKCSDCQKSFDATCNLLEVDIAKFPRMPEVTIPPLPPEPAPTVAPRPEKAPEVAAPVVPEVTVSEPAQEESADSAAEPEAAVEPPKAAVAQAVEAAVSPSQENQTEPSPAPAVTPAAMNPAQAAAQEAHTLIKHAEPLSHIIPRESKPVFQTPASVTVQKPRKAARSRRSGTAALVLTMLILLLILGAALALIFNQRIIAAAPSAQPLFEKVCGKLPCPGFYLADINAFVVSKTNLRPVDNTGNFMVEVTLFNGSAMPQAIPSLDFELIDDQDTSLMHKTLSPAEFLNDAGAKILAPERSLTVRISMQSNVTPARCIVKPVY